MRQIRASFDRYEDDVAIFYADDNHELIRVSRQHVPAGMGDGARVILSVRNGEVIRVRYDPVATEAARARVRNKLRRLGAGEHLKESTQTS